MVAISLSRWTIFTYLLMFPRRVRRPDGSIIGLLLTTTVYFRLVL